MHSSSSEQNVAGRCLSLSLHLLAAARRHIPLAGANLMGTDLYMESRLTPSAVFKYTTGANYINRLFAYLNRHWASENVMRVERVFILYIPCVPRAIGLSWLMHRSHSSPLSDGVQISFYMSKESKQSSLAPSCAHRATAERRRHRSGSRQESRGVLCVPRERLKQGLFRQLQGTFRNIIALRDGGVL
jgi:hypothetical protein